ncbi:MAG: thrombospondin type 3 repeat-containing protein [Verrucomicrobia bacterium]|nr:thrombospondin type 3 repeat-containing protein [Verrucomicrobiota bacterium]
MTQTLLHHDGISCRFILILAGWLVAMPALATIPIVEDIDADDDVLSVDWAPDDTHVGVGTGTILAKELKVYSFSAITEVLTLRYQTNYSATPQPVNAVRWHPSQHYLAVGSQDNSAHELTVYNFNEITHKPTATNSVDFGTFDSVKALAWNPNGNTLAVGTDISDKEIILYSYGPGSLSTSRVFNVDSSNTRQIMTNAMAWHPGGTNLAVGFAYNSSSLAEELRVYSWNGSILTEKFAANMTSLHDVSAVGWSANGRVLAVGLHRATASAAQKLLLYRESGGDWDVDIAYVPPTLNNIVGLEWSPEGNLLAVAYDRSALGADVGLYRYREDTDSLEYLDGALASLSSTDDANDIRWSEDGRYLAVGHENDKVYILEVKQADLRLTKTVSSYLVCPESNLVYSLNVFNAGPDPAVSVVITDTLPSQVTYEGSSWPTAQVSQVGQTLTFDFGTNTLPSSFGALISVTVSVNTAASGIFTNFAAVYSETTDPEFTNNLGFATNAVDFDCDGIANELDNCPTNFNPDQANSDADGFGDVCDNCISNSNPDQLDVDFDGLGNDCDNCPTNPNPGQVNFDGDPFGDDCDDCPFVYNETNGLPDVDADGFADLCDNCPTNSNAGQEDGDSDGVGNVCDNCPSDANPDQANPDGDNRGSACDNCPDVANDQSDNDGDLIGNACDPDIDGDDLPNDWESLYGFNPNFFEAPETTNDPDNDGYSNLEEYIGNTNPTNPASFFAVQMIGNTTGLWLQVPSETGRLFDVWTSTNRQMTDWTLYATNLPSTSGTTQLPEPDPQPGEKNYRVKVRLEHPLP